MSGRDIGGPSQAAYIAFVGRELRPILVALDLEREAALKRSMIAWAVVSIFGATIAWLAFPSAPALFIAVVVAAAVIGGVAQGRITERYRSRFKSRLIAKLVTFYDPSLRYEPEAGISRAEFESARLFREHGVDKFSSEDLVTGKLGATDIRFAEAKAQYEKEDSKGRKTDVTIFNGVFFTADFNKHFAGETYVLPDTAQRALGSFGQTLQSWSSTYGEIVKLEDPEFERAFVVYGSNQIEARYILSSAMMAQLLEFKARCPRKFRVGFRGSRVYVAVDQPKGLFTPPLLRRLDSSTFEEYWDELKLFAGIVKTLNLDTRIWTKE